MEPLIPYDEFTTGLTYADVYAMLWVNSDDSSMWRQKSRGVVLRLWASIKRDMYEAYVAAREDAAERAELEDALLEELQSDHTLPYVTIRDHTDIYVIGMSTCSRMPRAVAKCPSVKKLYSCRCVRARDHTLPYAKEVAQTRYQLLK